MINKDKTNITFSHTVSSLYSKEGSKFQEKKYLPKIEFILKYFKQNSDKIFLLDIGVGYGFLLYLLEQKFGFKHLFGMDPFSESIKIAKNFTSADIRKGKIEINPWPFDDVKFDVITCLDVLEHLKNPEIFFINVRKYLKKNGIVIITTPNKNLPYLMRGLPKIGKPDNNPTHINVRYPRYWKKLIKKNNWKILKLWYGEHLTHVEYIPNVINKVAKLFNFDPRKIPIINWFEQSLCIIMASKILINHKNDR